MTDRSSRRPRGAVVLLGLAALSGGCRQAGGLAASELHSAPVAGDVMSARDRTRAEAVAAARVGAGNAEGYLIGPDDLLDIRIPDLVLPAAPLVRPVGFAPLAEAPVPEQGFRVNAAGDVTLPLIGAVHAQGLTPTALEEVIAERLAEAHILRSPQVSVRVGEYRSGVVAVIGSVERPGLYPLTRPAATVADLVWTAGGPNKDAGRVVEFVPASEAQAEPIRLDLEVLLHATGVRRGSLNPPVRPGDVVTLSPAGNVLVDGWVEKPGSYPVTRGLTVSGAIAAAGGRLFPADRRHATVKRVLGPGEERSFPIDLEAVTEGRAADVPITDGDVVHLPASTARLVPWGMWSVARELVRVGGNVLLF